MSRKPSLMTRLITAKLVGFVVGILAFVGVAILWPDESMRLRFGFWAWYMTFGGIIGICGVMDNHPVLRMPMPFWFRGPLIGGWMNFVVVLLMHDQVAALMRTAPYGLDWFRNPLWFVAEGVLIGLLIDGIATRVGGEGAELY